jgi:hypothetical protein
MGIVNILLVAHPREAVAVAESDEPSRKWDGLCYRGLDRIKLATLWALIEIGAADDKLGERLEQILTIPAGEKGPWVDIVPASMLSALVATCLLQGVGQLRHPLKRTVIVNPLGERCHLGL